MIEAVNITKKFDNEIIISDFNIKIAKGELIALTGESGKGKTTILNILGLLEKPDSGRIIIDGLENPNRKDIMLAQRHKLGYLFQNYALIENETVEENLKIALGHQKRIDKKSKMKQALDFVNLNPNVLKKRIYKLSGGEQQRVAIARLFLKESDYIFADEPTGNLDSHNRDLVFNLLIGLTKIGKGVVFVTHDLELAKKAHKWLQL